jgi:outer membrane protein assembly factor BamE (lipoprotein component of BamABCDE complex)
MKGQNMHIRGGLWTVLTIAIAMSGCAQVDRLTQGNQTDKGQAHSDSTAQKAPDTHKADSSSKSEPQGRYTKATDAESARGIYGNPPRHSRFSKLRIGMSAKEVTDLIGEPTDQKTYMTGKVWIPFYFGSDRVRMEYRYKGQGVLTFVGGGGVASSHFTLYRVIYNPKEEGYEL